MNLMLDGRIVTFEGRPTILEVARANGVDIPSLCDYPGLEPFAACRLCLVEVKGRRGYVPACHTTAEEGLEVRTATPEIVALRRRILELILAEHPNACLICAEKSSCDEYKSTIRKTGEVTGCVLCPINGRCQLQRVVEAIGVERVHFPSLRRAGEVRRDDPFIDRDNSLCILCGRCVRVCHEVRGASVLTFAWRGSETVIGTAQDRRLLDSGCRFCGACVDVCPTGSLADRGIRYERSPDTEKRALCPFCGQGCRLRIGLREGRILGTAPDPDGQVNRGQACVKGRFLVKAAVHHPRRLLRPMVRKDGRLREVPWEEALGAAATRLTEIGPGRTAVAFSAQSSCEDLFVLSRFSSEVLKAPGVAGPWVGSAAAELRGLGRAEGRSVALNFFLSEVGRAGVIMVLGEDLPVTQPILGLEVTRAVRNGAAVISVCLDGGPANGQASIKAPIPAAEVRAFLQALAAGIGKNRGQAGDKAKGSKGHRPGHGIPEEKTREIARLLETRRPALFLFGPAFLEATGGRSGLSALSDLADLTAGRILPLDGEANLRGALEIAGAFPFGAVPGGESAGSAAGGNVRAFYLAGPFPGFKPGAAELVILQGSYDDGKAAFADIVLPETTSFESDGTFVNVEGRTQLSAAAVEAQGEARPAWLILSELAAKMGHTGFAYSSVREVRRDLARLVPAFRDLPPGSASEEGLFLHEEAGRSDAVIPGGTIPSAEAETRPSAGPDPDDYKGLNLALDHKSLKLVRGR
ncbi:MAG: molybdopterin-dependent oxidoreductase [Candidatus Aminicenantales bacterium]|jgi:predicted molibdopterin-dependent oxidoreductase YjgC